MPTEDGPYCDSGQLEKKKTEQYDSKTFGISLDDIENEYLTIIDKKANFSVKYGDFLTNCDIMELDSLNQIASDNSQVELKCLFDQPKPTDPPKDYETGPVKTAQYVTDNTVKPTNIILNENVNRKKTVTKVDPIVYNFDSNKNNLTQIEEVQNTSNPNHMYLVPIEFEDSKPENKQMQKPEVKKNIRIISEKRISEPVSFVGTLQPLSPSRVLPLPNTKKKLLNSDVLNIPEPGPPGPPSANVTEATLNLTDPMTSNVPTDQIHALPKGTPNVVIKNNNKVLPRTSLLKNKIPPERIAAIAEKRKFNMKLRDIVEDCLDKLDEPVVKRKTLSPKKQFKDQEVRSYLSREKELPNINEYTIAYLEARMVKMENNLLNKIDQNSQKIIDLKQSVQTTSCKKLNVSTQTGFNEEQHKRYLYHEISKYLSPKANSLIYEELFIDKYTHDKYTRSSSAKRTKHN